MRRGRVYMYVCLWMRKAKLEAEGKFFISEGNLSSFGSVGTNQSWVLSLTMNLIPTLHFWDIWNLWTLRSYLKLKPWNSGPNYLWYWHSTMGTLHVLLLITYKDYYINRKLSGSWKDAISHKQNRHLCLLSEFPKQEKNYCPKGTDYWEQLISFT